MALESCEPCGIKNLEPGHNQTLEHRFNFKVWAWNNYRKALVKNREGIEVEIYPEEKNGPKLISEFDTNKGRYTFKVPTKQFLQYQNKLTFIVEVKNKRKSLIYLTTAQQLHPCLLFQFINEYQDRPLLIESKCNCTFQIIYNLKEVVNSFQEIPIIFTFRHKIDAENEFTIAKSLIVKIVDIEDEFVKNKSPFTSKPWLDVDCIEPPVKQMFNTNNYPIPSKYEKILKFGLNYDQTMNSTEAHDLKLLKSKLTDLNMYNYCDYWHILLWIDEMGETIKLQCYNMENVKMDFKDDYWELEVPGLAEKRPSIIVGDLIEIQIQGDHKAYTGVVKRINEETINIFFVNDELVEEVSKYDHKIELNVRFKLSRVSYERMHAGIDRTIHNRMLEALFPNERLLVAKNDKFKYHLLDSEFFNECIIQNLEQKRTVINILNGTSQSAPYLVFGPPGTGKTVTIVEAMLQIVNKTKKKILVCAPSNAACDMIAMKIVQFLKLPQFYSKTNLLMRLHSESRNFNSISTDLLKYSNINPDRSYRRIFIDELRQYRIVVTTLVHIGKYNQDYRPDCVFIDEAAQAQEPETDVAIGLLTLGKLLVLAGDPKQLGPVLTSRAAQRFNLGISLLERLMKHNSLYANYNPNFITMLKLNFRSHCDILRLVNELFYDNSLVPVSVKAEKDPIVKIAIYPRIHNKKVPKGSGSAIEFCGINSKERKEGNSPSFFNMDELCMVIKYVKTLLKLQLQEEYKVKENDIGIITPYIRQVHKIKIQLARNGFKEIEVGTAETFQGREKRIILISTVRACPSLLAHDKKFNLGFVRDDKRFNVIISRAISKSIIIGCPNVLSTDKKWLKLIEQCEDSNNYFGCPFQRRSSEFKEKVLSRMKSVKLNDQHYI